VDGFPTLIFFEEGVPKKYNGERTYSDIVKEILRKVNGAVREVQSEQELGSSLG